MGDALGHDGLQPLRVDIAQLQDRMTSCERSLESKVEGVAMSEVEKNLANLRAHASGIESSLQDRMTSCERSLESKVECVAMSEVEKSLANLRAHASGIESSLLETSDDMQSQLTDM